MKYAIFFGLFSVYLFTLSCVLGGAGWLLLWPSLSFAVLAAAYAGLGPCVYGKRANGRLAWWALLLLLPYLLITWAAWHIHRLVRKEPCCHEIVPGLWLGRRAFPAELPGKIDLVIDLTSEFPAPRGVCAGRSYFCLPVLDALTPEERPLRELVEQIAAWQGNVYIHCALGRGRSAMIVAAVLVKRGLASDVTQAEALIRQARSSVRLKPAQRRLLERLFLTP